MNVSTDPAVLPARISADLVKRDTQGVYACPNCQVEKAVPSSGTRWVRCPIFDEAYICEGCCIDIASVARDPAIEDNPYRSLLDEIAQATNQTQKEVRLTCLEHQVTIVEDKLSQPDLPDIWREARRKQLQWLTRLMHELRNGT